MVVLVTRPNVEGHELCMMLNESGIASLHHPLINIEPSSKITGLDRALQRADIVIAVSQHAVSYAHQYLQEHALNWPKTSHYLAVGQKTAQLLSKLSQQKVNYPSQSDSEHLLELDELQNVAHQKIVILRGNSGRELIYQTLDKRMADVSYVETYTRQHLDFNSDSKVIQWQEAKVSHLVVTSSDQLTHFLSQLTSAQIHWIQTLQLYVPSERIARQAKALGFVYITNVGSATNKELLAALRLNKQDD
ncbi:uroporphyrinogen-III synthase [Vibrio sonorensis]|uniref:uroporphyrinogen-III synthase n=1 Tax=Vibrio sonorensis TaxID=1004316 RepID=UPI0008D9367E|nr:uroporphyrinogen-III synthase [Vibrio sonorensis]